MISVSGFAAVVGPAAAADTADVAVDEAERGGHETSEVGDCQQCQRDANDSVENRHNATPHRLRRHVTVTYTTTTHLS